MYNNNKIFGNKGVEMKVDDIIAVHLTNLPILIVTQGLASGRCMLLENTKSEKDKEMKILSCTVTLVHLTTLHYPLVEDLVKVDCFTS